ncbi:SPOR domain-containing protein [Parasphingopyxis sp.]|uniref:SPOR domain-containing protein n=1 Tax=Parasphingopyxis sp. TaxID=1920299 RepID=UPI0026204280|nr:SPOR domain-containing protein [Parasphingopyxis sp.]
MSNEDALDARDEERLPWLEAVEEDDEEGVGLLTLIGGVLVVLIAIALVVGGIFWLRDRDAAPPDGAELIAAPEGDYRVRPSEAGGMEVEGEGDAAFAASEGGSPEGRIDRSAAPEEPVAGRRVAAGEDEPVASGSSARIPANNRRLAESAPQPESSSGGASSGAATAASGRLIQLGAFSSEAAANSAWAQIARQNNTLNSLDHSVSSVQAGGRTLYRLRAAASSREAARSLCSRLRNAGQACSVVVN